METMQEGKQARKKENQKHTNEVSNEKRKMDENKRGKEERTN